VSVKHPFVFLPQGSQSLPVVPIHTRTTTEFLHGGMILHSTRIIPAAGWIFPWLLLWMFGVRRISAGSPPKQKILDPRPGWSAQEEDDKNEDDNNVFVPRPRIIGGSNAQQDRYPYFVSMIDNAGRHTCAGTLVAPDIVLTAAHCRGSFAKAQIGRWDRRSTSSNEDDYEEIAIDFPELPHPNYSDEGFKNDFMLVKLTSQSTKTFIRLNNNPDVPLGIVRDELTIVGFGNTVLAYPVIQAFCRK